MKSPKFQTALKALLLIGLGLFLYTRISNGSLYFYINQRFAGLTLLAVCGLILIGISYQFGAPHAADEGESDHGGRADHHALSWGGVLLVALPMLVGVLIPPRPLGATALENREVSISTSGSGMPAAVRSQGEKANLDKNILDWVYEFQTREPQQFAGQEAEVIGFVFRDERFAADEFLVTRYVVSCCVADAAYVGLVVRWPDAADLSADQWVQIRGRFDVGEFDSQTLPVLAADVVTVTDVPSQPYLYP
jgi:uncharacterized repeat protein (TIGR03943 family)